MKYNRYFINHFRDCRLLVSGYDPHRVRQVEIRLIPGEWDVVGISDGIDAWVAPIVVDSPLFQKARSVMADIRNGKDPKPLEARRRVLIDDEEPKLSPTGRVAVASHPNIQTIPLNTDEARRVRRALLPTNF